MWYFMKKIYFQGKEVYLLQRLALFKHQDSCVRVVKNLTISPAISWPLAFVVACRLQAQYATFWTWKKTRHVCYFPGLKPIGILTAAGVTKSAPCLFPDFKCAFSKPKRSPEWILKQHWYVVRAFKLHLDPWQILVAYTARPCAVQL